VHGLFAYNNYVQTGGAAAAADSDIEMMLTTTTIIISDKKLTRLTSRLTKYAKNKAENSKRLVI